MAQSDFIHAQNIEDIELIGINTEAAQLALLENMGITCLQIGEQLTQGRGTGGNAAVGEAAAKADEAKIKNAITGADIVFITGSLGGGTGTGAAATVSAEIAKEQATATLGLVSSGFDGTTTASNIAALFGSMSDFPRLAAFSFLVFNLFVPPCMVAIATTFREMGSQQWGWFAMVFQLAVGYVIAFSSYQLGMLACGGGFGLWTAVTLAVDAFVLWAIFRPAPKEALA